MSETPLSGSSDLPSAACSVPTGASRLSAEAQAPLVGLAPDLVELALGCIPSELHAQLCLPRLRADFPERYSHDLGCPGLEGAPSSPHLPLGDLLRGHPWAPCCADELWVRAASALDAAGVRPGLIALLRQRELLGELERLGAASEDPELWGRYLLAAASSRALARYSPAPLAELLERELLRGRKLACAAPPYQLLASLGLSLPATEAALAAEAAGSPAAPARLALVCAAEASNSPALHALWLLSPCLLALGGRDVLVLGPALSPPPGSLTPVLELAPDLDLADPAELAALVLSVEILSQRVYELQPLTASEASSIWASALVVARAATRGLE